MKIFCFPFKNYSKNDFKRESIFSYLFPFDLHIYMYDLLYFSICFSKIHIYYFILLFCIQPFFLGQLIFLTIAVYCLRLYPLFHFFILTIFFILLIFWGCYSHSCSFFKKKSSFFSFLFILFFIFLFSHPSLPPS